MFAEAAACGVPTVCGRSGGAAEAVADGVTGLVVDQPRSVPAAAATLGRLLADPSLRRDFATASRVRAVEHFSYDRLAGHLHAALTNWGPGAPSYPAPSPARPPMPVSRPVSTTVAGTPPVAGARPVARTRPVVGTPPAAGTAPGARSGGPSEEGAAHG